MSSSVSCGSRSISTASVARTSSSRLRNDTPSSSSRRRNVREVMHSAVATASMSGMRPGWRSRWSRTVAARPVRAWRDSSKCRHIASLCCAVCSLAMGKGKSNTARGKAATFSRAP